MSCVPYCHGNEAFRTALIHAQSTPTVVEGTICAGFGAGVGAQATGFEAGFAGKTIKSDEPRDMTVPHPGGKNVKQGISN